jgi:GntR family transcriptional regulator
LLTFLQLSCCARYRKRTLDLLCSISDTTPMALLGIKLQAGESIFAQVLLGSQRAIATGQFSPGQQFPSVRGLATELRIHPKTAHKVIQHLISEHWLEVRPGIGTVVATPPSSWRLEQRRVLRPHVQQLVVEARRIGASLQAVVQAVSAEWSQLDKAAEGYDK